MAWWLGIGAGLGLMSVYAALRLVTHRLARARSDLHTFTLVELGGLGGRMLTILIAAAIVLAFAPVSPVAFVATVLSLLVLSIAIETVLVLRRTD